MNVKKCERPVQNWNTYSLPWSSDDQDYTPEHFNQKSHNIKGLSDSKEWFLRSLQVVSKCISVSFDQHSCINHK